MPTRVRSPARAGSFKSVSAGSDTVLGKAVALLRAFRPDDHVLTLAEFVRRTELNKATAHRLAGQLVELRLLDRVENGYRLSGGLFELGMMASLERSLMEMAMPFLQDLYERTHETVHLGVRDGHDVLYVAKIGGHRAMSAPSRTGGRLPMYCTAIGKALLAFSDPDLVAQVLNGPLPRRTAHTLSAPGMLRSQLVRIPERGVAFEREESTLGIVCVAAPVLGADNQAVAAISVAGPTMRFRPEQHATAVRAAAEGLRATIARRDLLR